MLIISSTYALIGEDPPEMELWRAVLRQAGDDLLNPNERIRADAITFFASDHLLLIMDLAGIDPDLAPILRAKAKELAEALPESRQPNARRISYRGQTHSLTEWAKPTGVNVTTLCHRLCHGWSTERALTTPGRHYLPSCPQLKVTPEFCAKFGG